MRILASSIYPTIQNNQTNFPISTKPSIQFGKVEKADQFTTASVGVNRAQAIRFKPATITLDGKSLTLEQVVQIAREGSQVTIKPDALQRVSQGFNLVWEAAKQHMPVYGLTVGTGWNKDQPVFSNNELSEALVARSREFNTEAMRGHAGAIGDVFPPDIVRAGMAIRLNTMLSGESGVQSEAARCLAEMLNHDIVPIIPNCGTIGEADPLLASHVGLAMSGEWKVLYQGKEMTAEAALKKAGIKPVQLVGKDFLSILSTNAITAGSAVLAVKDTEAFLKREAKIFALSLEGLNGNVSPFLEANTKARPFPEMVQAAGMIRQALDGSYLWDKSATRPLQDPISYRGMAYYLGESIRGVKDAKKALAIQINHTDDNPRVEVNPEKVETHSEQVRDYVIGKQKPEGAIYPTSNFDSTPFTAPVKQLLLGLQVLSQAMSNQVVRFEDPKITHLPRYLIAPGSTGHGVGAIHYPVIALNNRNLMLSMPVPHTGIGLAGQIEDMGNTGEIAIANLHQMNANLERIASSQLLHATQAIDMRGVSKLGRETKSLYTQYRKEVPFIHKDRIFTTDMDNGLKVVKQNEDTSSSSYKIAAKL